MRSARWAPRRLGVDGLLCPEQGIGPDAADDRLPVKVRPAHEAGIPHEADEIADGDRLSLADSDAVEVVVAAKHPCTVVDDDDVAVEVHRPGQRDYTTCGGSDRGALHVRDVGPGVRGIRPAVDGAHEPEAIGYRAGRWQYPGP